MSNIEVWLQWKRFNIQNSVAQPLYWEIGQGRDELIDDQRIRNEYRSISSVVPMVRKMSENKLR